MPTMRDARPVLISVNEVEADEEATATVFLSYQGKEHAGQATGSSHAQARPRLVGEATLRALEGVSGGQLSLDLAAVATTDVGAYRVAIAQVVASDSPNALVGSAAIHEDDPSMATARAVLDALNRHVASVI